MRHPPNDIPASWVMCDLLATELERWVGWMEDDPEGFRKVRSLMGLRARELRRKQHNK